MCLHLVYSTKRLIVFETKALKSTQFVSICQVRSFRIENPSKTLMLGRARGFRIENQWKAQMKCNVSYS